MLEGSTAVFCGFQEAATVCSGKISNNVQESARDRTSNFGERERPYHAPAAHRGALFSAPACALGGRSPKSAASALRSWSRPGSGRQLGAEDLNGLRLITSSSTPHKRV